MKHTPFVFTFISLAILGGCNKAPDVEQSAKIENAAAKIAVMPPIAKKVPYKMTVHGDTRIDNYYWMRDDERKDTISYARKYRENRSNCTTIHAINFII